MEIHIETSVLAPEQIATVEKLYNAKFVCETCLKGQGGSWSNQPVAIFYQENIPANIPGAGHHFGLYWAANEGGNALPSFGQVGQEDRFRLMITNAQSAVNEDWEGIIDGDKVYYSRYRHDFVRTPTGFVDGGRDYCRRAGGYLVNLRVVNDKLTIVNNIIEDKKND